MQRVELYPRLLCRPADNVDAAEYGSDHDRTGGNDCEVRCVGIRMNVRDRRTYIVRWRPVVARLHMMVIRSRSHDRRTRDRRGKKRLAGFDLLDDPGIAVRSIPPSCHWSEQHETPHATPSQFRRRHADASDHSGKASRHTRCPTSPLSVAAA